MDLETARKSITNALQGFRRRAAISHAYHNVYATPEGQTVLHDLMRRGGILETSPLSEDSRFYEGRRSLALEIVKELRWTEAEMIALARETTKEDMERLVE
jgi:hypothetical protein